MTTTLPFLFLLFSPFLPSLTFLVIIWAGRLAGAETRRSDGRQRVTQRLWVEGSVGCEGGWRGEVGEEAATRPYHEEGGDDE